MGGGGGMVFGAATIDVGGPPAEGGGK
jgi:hypothetical protein